MRSLSGIFLGSFAALALAFATPDPGLAQGANILVRMTDEFRYQPESITVRVGDTVEWINFGRLVGHTVTADPDEAFEPQHVVLPPGAEAFDSGLLPIGESFRHTFTVPGRYVYFCESHEAQGMVGEVIVE